MQPLCPVADMGFSKCSGRVVSCVRNRLKFAIVAQFQPFSGVHAAELLGAYRTLRKSDILHRAQRLH